MSKENTFKNWVAQFLEESRRYLETEQDREPKVQE